MFAAQLLSSNPRIKVYFLTLTVVGSLLAGLGWFLFATTANRTSQLLSRPSVYTVVAVLAGIDIMLAITAPAHSIYWVLPEGVTQISGFAQIVPHLGYWVHISFLLSLFVAGTLLFADAWNARRAVEYSRAYTFAGTATALAIIGSAVLAPGGLSVASLVALSLPTVGWVQASRGRVLESLWAVIRSG